MFYRKVQRATPSEARRPVYQVFCEGCINVPFPEGSACYIGESLGGRLRTGETCATTTSLFPGLPMTRMWNTMDTSLVSTRAVTL